MFFFSYSLYILLYNRQVNVGVMLENWLLWNFNIDYYYEETRKHDGRSYLTGQSYSTKKGSPCHNTEAAASSARESARTHVRKTAKLPGMLLWNYWLFIRACKVGDENMATQTTIIISALQLVKYSIREQATRTLRKPTGKGLLRVCVKRRRQKEYE